MSARRSKLLGSSLVVLLALGCSAAANVAVLQVVGHHGKLGEDNGNTPSGGSLSPLVSDKNYVMRPGPGGTFGYGSRVYDATGMDMKTAGKYKLEVANGFGRVDSGEWIRANTTAQVPTKGFGRKNAVVWNDALLAKRGAEIANLDKQAAADFVRNCQASVFDDDKRFLPVDSLTRFCRTTGIFGSDFVECKKNLSPNQPRKVGDLLAKTHAKNSKPGELIPEMSDLARFCAKSYEWFQGKYGMDCPKQCDKVMCKATCLYLESKKTLDTENRSIQKARQANKKAQFDLAKLYMSISSTQTEVARADMVKRTYVDRGYVAYHAQGHATKVRDDDIVSKTVADENVQKRTAELADINSKLRDLASGLSGAILSVSIQKEKIDGLKKDASQDRNLQDQNRFEEMGFNSKIAQARTHTQVQEARTGARIRKQLKDAYAANATVKEASLSTLVALMIPDEGLMKELQANQTANMLSKASAERSLKVLKIVQSELVNKLLQDEIRLKNATQNAKLMADTVLAETAWLDKLKMQLGQMQKPQKPKIKSNGKYKAGSNGVTGIAEFIKAAKDQLKYRVMRLASEEKQLLQYRPELVILHNLAAAAEGPMTAPAPPGPPLPNRAAVKTIQKAATKALKTIKKAVVKAANKVIKAVNKESLARRGLWGVPTKAVVKATNEEAADRRALWGPPPKPPKVVKQAWQLAAEAAKTKKKQAVAAAKKAYVKAYVKTLVKSIKKKAVVKEKKAAVKAANKRAVKRLLAKKLGGRMAAKDFWGVPRKAHTPNKAYVKALAKSMKKQAAVKAANKKAAKTRALWKR